MIVKQVIEVIVTDMEKGNITGLMFDDNYFKLVDKKKVSVKIKKVNKIELNKKNKRKRFENKVDKWIKEKDITTFNIDNYFKDNPDDLLQKKRIIQYISKMINDKTLIQVSNNTFLLNNDKRIVKK